MSWTLYLFYKDNIIDNAYRIFKDNSVEYLTCDEINLLRKARKEQNDPNSI